MNHLLIAAKAVIDAADTGDRWCAIANLSAAVKRAEKPPAGLMSGQTINNLSEYGKACARKAWADSQQAERERIRSRVKLAAEKTFNAGGYYVGPQHYLIEQFVDALLEDADA